MKLSVHNRAFALLGGVIIAVFVLGLFALVELHNANSTAHQIAWYGAGSTNGTSGQITTLVNGSQSMLTLSVIVIGVLVMLAVTGVIVATLLLERRSSLATRDIGVAARAISSGQISSFLDAATRPEYGKVSAEFGAMVDYLRSTAALAEKIAEGDMTVEITPLSEQDALGKSLATIAGTMRRLTAENEQLIEKDSQRDTIDTLTGLPNRAALMRDLEAALEHAQTAPDLTLVLFDLDGFKPYNDAFSHPAGDALLVRLAERLRRSLDGSSSCYRMGGDEFCILATAGEKAGNALARRGAKALSEQGEAFSVSCSFGTAFLPREARSASDALRLADKRMYERKLTHASVTRESTTVLLKMLGERNPELISRASEVAELAVETALALGLPDNEVSRIKLAAKLRDVGKAAIPDMILNKPGPLDHEEWEFMRRHTQIGARIISAAPSLANAAELIRAHHEWHNGEGYPDRLVGDAIPIGAQIIAVCDAFGAMTSDRAYRTALTEEEALGEIGRCSGTQFGPQVVREFAKVMSRRRPRAVA